MFRKIQEILEEHKQKIENVSWTKWVFSAIFLIAALIFCVVVGVGRHQLLGTKELVSVQDQASEEPGKTVTVDVKGAVASPGIYSLPSGSRVQDVIEAAGGFLDEADSAQLNLAKKLSDEDMVVVNHKDTEAGAEESGADSGLLDLNTAGAEDLEKLPGIGPVLSERIVEIEPSGIRKFFDIVNEMEDAISLGVGEPAVERVRLLSAFCQEKGIVFQPFDRIVFGRYDDLSGLHVDDSVVMA